MGVIGLYLAGNGFREVKNSTANDGRLLGSYAVVDDKSPIETVSDGKQSDAPDFPNYCSFAYSALASFRIGTSGSASFHSARKSL